MFAFLYFTKDNPDDNAVSVSNSISETTTESAVTESTKSPTTTTATTTSTSTTTTITSTVTTTESYYEDVSSYIGFWHKESIGYDRELTISSVKRNNIIFSLWYYRTDSIEDVLATLENDTAYFDTGDVQGYLTFEDDIITVVITNSSRPYMTPELMTFDGRMNILGNMKDLTIRPLLSRIAFKLQILNYLYMIRQATVEILLEKLQTNQNIQLLRNTLSQGKPQSDIPGES